MVVIRWPASLPSIPMIRVQIPLKPTVYFSKILFEMNENRQKDAGIGPLKKLNSYPVNTKFH